MDATTTIERQTATQYDLLVAIDELLKPSYEHLEASMDQLQREFEDWLDVPAIRRKDKLKTQQLDDELRNARNRFIDARQWQWSRRVAGYANGNMFIAEA